MSEIKNYYYYYYIFSGCTESRNIVNKFFRESKALTHFHITTFIKYCYHMLLRLYM